jgi:cytochrome c oxidase subunit 2
MNITWLVIFFVQTITQALLYYFSFKYRGRKDQKALYFSDDNKLEIIWSVIPAVVLAGLILYGLYAWANIMFINEDEDTVVIEVYAQQFKWTARYSGEDNVLGKANVRLIEGINTLGVDLSDPNALDDKVATEIHIPKGKKIHFKFRSQDVLHSAYFPHFRAQMNCIPGMVTEKVSKINGIRAKKSIELVAKGETALDPYTFDYLLLCNKICGASHYNMQMKVVVDSPEDYKKWLNEKPTLVQELKTANAPAPVDGAVVPDTTKAKDTAATAKVVMNN